MSASIDARTAAWWTLAGLLAACASGPSSQAPAATTGTTNATATQPRAGTAEPPDRAAHMQSTFWQAINARDAIIEGNLPSAKHFADELAHHDYAAALPEDWKHWVKTMQQRAEELTLAPDIAAASQAVSMIALSCGECHAQMQAGPSGAPPEDPHAQYKSEESLSERMVRHELAADDLWLGLVEPSEELWQRGTVTLTRAPLEPPTRGGEPVDPGIASEIEQIRGLAKTARTASSYQARAETYGQILSHCGSCHYRSAR